MPLITFIPIPTKFGVEPPRATYRTSPPSRVGGQADAYRARVSACTAFRLERVNGPPPVCTCGTLSYRWTGDPCIALLKSSIEDNPQIGRNLDDKALLGSKAGQFRLELDRAGNEGSIDSTWFRERNSSIEARFFFLSPTVYTRGLLRAPRQCFFRCCCCCCCSGWWKINAQSSSSTPFFPSLRSFVFTLPRVVRGKSDFAPTLSLSWKIFPTRRKYSPPIWTSFLAEKLLIFFFSIIAKCFERENAPVYGWLIIWMIKATQCEIKDTRPWCKCHNERRILISSLRVEGRRLLKKRLTR